MRTHNQNYLESIETVLAWDLPDKALADAINNQFGLMDGLDSENAWDRSQDSCVSFRH